MDNFADTENGKCKGADDSTMTVDCDRIGVSSWSTSDVAKWLYSNELEYFIQVLTVEYGVDGRTLLRIDEQYLRQLPLPGSLMDHVDRLVTCIAQLKVRGTRRIHHRAACESGIKGSGHCAAVAVLAPHYLGDPAPMYNPHHCAQVSFCGKFGSLCPRLQHNAARPATAARCVVNCLEVATRSYS
jgi:SAM domain (Sterile alpha motif)